MPIKGRELSTHCYPNLWEEEYESREETYRYLKNFRSPFRLQWLCFVLIPPKMLGGGIARRNLRG